jgi:hypothetical protein
VFAAVIIAASTDLPQAALPAEPRPTVVPDALDPAPFGSEHPGLDGWATGDWWTETRAVPGDGRRGAKAARPFPLDVPRRDVIAFAVYTVSLQPAATTGVLKLTAQLFPLEPGEPMEARLEVDRGAGWEEVGRAPVLYPGWDVHFRVADWDASRTVPYRVCHGGEATFTGTIRRDPADRERVCVAVLSCNSSSTTGPRDELVANLRVLDPDLLFFAGDQTYRHTQHTVGWIEFGLQFRDVLRDRPTVTIPDDHDVGHPNLWGANGKRALEKTGPDGGYYYPAAYVNMVQRQQTWHLPDPVDPAPVEQGITVYFTRLVLGGLDLAILEDRKFKTGPKGTIPQLGPRPDHITDPAYDRAAVDLPGLELLGPRQLDWLDRWSNDTHGVRAKAVLSQTAFCGAVHMHGKVDERLLADLDCNGWPQSGRNAALRLIRQAGAVHLCGDQHLAVVVQHGIDAFRDGPWAFTAPAIVNTIYGRWWHPEREQPGLNPIADSPLPWTGDYEDGLGNKLTMVAYANPVDPADERQRGDGFGTAVWDFPAETIAFHCVPRFATLRNGQPEEYPGWPVTVPLEVPWKHAVKDDVPARFVVPGHDRPMRLLDEMHALHLPGAFIPCTLWDAWLTTGTCCRSAATMPSPRSGSGRPSAVMPRWSRESTTIPTGRSPPRSGRCPLRRSARSATRSAVTSRRGSGTPTPAGSSAGSTSRAPHGTTASPSSTPRPWPPASPATSRPAASSTGSTAGGLGLDQEFLESIIVPQVMLEGFLGFEPGVDDFTVKPRLPAAWPALTVRGIHFHDRVLDVTAKADGTVVVDERPAR